MERDRILELDKCLCKVTVPTYLTLKNVANLNEFIAAVKRELANK